MRAEELERLRDERIIEYAIDALSARAPSFDPTPFDRRTVIRNDHSVGVIFEMSVRYIPSHEDEFEHSYAVEVEFIGDDVRYLIPGNLYTANEHSLHVSSFIHSSSELAVGSEDLARVFEHNESYQVIVTRAHGHGTDTYTINKETGRVAKTEDEHIEDELSVDGFEDIVEPEEFDALDEVEQVEEPDVTELHRFP